MMMLMQILLVMATLPSIGDLLVLTSSAQHYSYCKECARFPVSGSQYSNITDFKRILVDSNHSRIIVGARNAVFRLDLVTLKILNQTDFIELVPTTSDTNKCIKRYNGVSKDVCHNFIMLLLFDAERKIFACGTGAAVPKCWRFERSGALQATPPNGINGLSRCPKEPQESVVGLFTSNDYLFTGIRTSMQKPGVLYRSPSKDSYRKENTLKTRNEQVFEAPTNFVASFIGKDNYVYFWFRESAVEERSKVLVSRIARVCQFDTGGGFNRKIFTTLTKARLACTVNGKAPFYYNEIQSAFEYVMEDASDVFVYAVFHTPNLGVKVGAVCAYSFKKIESVFKSSTYLKKTSDADNPDLSSWVPVSAPPNTTEPGRVKCDPSLDTRSISLLSVVFGNSHPLLTDVIEPVDKQPLFVKASVGFTKIIVDKVANSSVNKIPVLFIGTDNGTIYKLFSNPANKEPHVVEQFDVFVKKEAIYDMKLYEGALYVSSKSSIVKVPVQKCNRYKTCRSCVSAQDPYCGWSGSECVVWGKKLNSFKQDISFGNFEKVCPETPPRCIISTVTDKPGATTILQCNAEGVPLPRVTGWAKDSTPIKYDDTSDDFKFENGDTANTQKLLIMNFGVQSCGSYQCSVSSKKGKSLCTFNLNGTLPVITSGVKKLDGVSYFYCEAVATPKAKVVVYKVINGKRSFTDGYRVALGMDTGTRRYYCVASNVLGLSVGKNLDIVDREIKGELKLTSETWSSDLQDNSSQIFRVLAEKVSLAVNKTYSQNAAFIRVKNMSFRKGSVVSVMNLEFAARPSDANEALLSDLQQAVNRGNISGLEVDSGHTLTEQVKTVNPTTITQAPTPTTVLISSIHPVPSTRISSTHPVPSTSQAPTAKPIEGGIGDTGLFAGAILAAIAITVVLSFALGVLCHDRTMRHCQRSPDIEYAHGRNITAVKYQKSPTNDDGKFRKHPSKRKLLRKQENAKEMQPNGDDIEHESEDSDGSAAGQISTKDDSCTERTPVKNINNENGKVLNIC